MGLSSVVKASYLNAGLGIKVVHPAAADVAGWVSIFTITGGLIQITGLYGVATVLHAGAAATVQFRHSTGGTVLSQVTLAVASPVGTIYAITGDPADPTIVSVGTGVLNTAPPVQGGMQGSGAGGIQQFGLVCGVGTIDVDFTVVTAGSTRFVLTYIPIDDTALVVIA